MSEHSAPLDATHLPWLKETRRRAQAVLTGPRAPHSLLVVGGEGAGLAQFGRWAIQVWHCESSELRPCGQCRACRWLATDAHPDHYTVVPIENSQEIRVDQVRDLIEQLALTGHGGSRRSALLLPAERLNRNAANSLLKLLEEPPSGALLVLAASQPARLPATIRSRCLRLDLPTPTLAESADWLARRCGGPEADWRRVLQMAGNAPCIACDWNLGEALQAVVDLERDVRHLGDSTAEPLLLAQQWDDERFELRLLALENLVTESLLVAGRNATAHLPSRAEMPKLRPMFELLDRIRAERALADTPLNRRHGLTVLLSAVQSALRGVAA